MKTVSKWSAVAACLMVGSVWAQADEARAKKIVSGVCFLCHGAEGESSSEVFPRLAGQHWEYVAKQLENFKSGKRKSTTMVDMAAKLTSDEMVALGKYFEKMSVSPEPAKDAELAAVGKYIFYSGDKFSGVAACASCHGKEAMGTAALPRLAGQYASYIEMQLRHFGKRERTNDNAVMHAIANKMTALEMAAVAEYLGGK
ncbi:c-type cytochrome [Rhodoferax ferrireducens]|uniref:c-type cytochrome n=1 Tax=Rhodoferax ferrireducens TaxID=192843 RepID=UPI001E620FF4|nr:c-type cytochrome [Rhodoferax ferrireducens]